MPLSAPVIRLESSVRQPAYGNAGILPAIEMDSNENGLKTGVMTFTKEAGFHPGFK